jgi:hypothetical protein
MTSFSRHRVPQCGGALAIAFLALAATASAQNILIAPKLRTGDTFKLEISRTRENTPGSSQDGKGSSTVNVTVLTVTPEGSTLEWESGLIAGNVGGVPEALMLTAGDAMRGIKPVIRLTPDGELAGLANEAEVLAKMQAAVDIIRRGAAESVPPANRPGFEAMLSQVLSPPILLASVVSDARIYFRLNGAALGVGQSATADLLQPNPFGGEPLPAKFTVRAESGNTDTASLVTTTVYDGAALMRLMSLMMEKTGDPVPKEEFAKLPAMQMGEEGRFVFDRLVGLMREATVTRRVTMGGQVRLDRTEIRLVAPPKR